jgi:hypothetical protein
MTRTKSRGATRMGIPGISKIQDVTNTWFDLWGQQVEALNDVWGDVCRPDAAAGDWPKAWNNLLHAWAGNIEGFCVALGGGNLFGQSGSPLVAFVIDRSAETDAQSQTVPLPPGVDPDTLIATPLVSLTQDGHPALATASILLLRSSLGIEIRVTINRGKSSAAPAPGDYLSLVCEPKAGAPGGSPLTNSPDPPLRRVVATVLVHFI